MNIAKYITDSTLAVTGFVTPEVKQIVGDTGETVIQAVGSVATTSDNTTLLVGAVLAIIVPFVKEGLVKLISKLFNKQTV